MNSTGPEESPGLEYRPLAEADLDAIAGLEAATNHLPWSRALFAAELANPQTCFWLLGWRLGQLLSFGGFWKAVDEAHITNIAVRPGHQRQGLGRELMQRLLERAAQVGCRRATLEVRQGNAPAIALYQELGFKPVALRPRYYLDTQEDALLMWKERLE